MQKYRNKRRGRHRDPGRAPPSRAGRGCRSAACKTDDEISWAREAARIAELNYARLLELARPGLSEDELAVELRWHSKSLGAEDNFLLLCAGPHNRAVQPSCGRTLRAGDI